ncbi:hypothetical protein ALP29_100262 [Pseudomonas syringae pv. avii]|uniref:Uncharacterized protein n=1 Tax=Pseudomonas syringae pv. avii TaxID=663959 RepID=A0A3M5VHP6_PSESX|nr:hypothetical protein PflA506_4800 [Pseudomonas fluorescens A506]RMT58079.1 hypothetical protein ALP43_100188 [Pseudomonas azotoformans]RMU57234.1 hypothetical protein ALP29_100262 [Pseudomonas syringae pv. avii]
MRDWRHVGDAGDLIATAVQSTDSRLTTWTWTLDVNVEVFQAVFQRSLTSTFSSYLSSKRGGLAGTAETRTTGGSPRKRVTLTVGDGHDCVVKRCMDVGDAINHCLFNFFTRTSSRFCHDNFPVDSLGRLLADRLTRTFTGTRVSLGTLTAYWKTTTMTQTAIATEVHQTLDFHVDFATQVTFSGELRHFATQLFNLLVAQILDLSGWVYPSNCANFLRSSATNTIDVGQRDNSVLVIWNVNACNTGHSVGLQLTATYAPEAKK